MSNSLDIKLNKEGRKIVNLFKYLVLIFVFLFVGIFSAEQRVKADTLVSQSVTTEKIQITLKGWYNGIDGGSVKFCSSSNSAACTGSFDGLTSAVWYLFF